MRAAPQTRLPACWACACTMQQAGKKFHPTPWSVCQSLCWLLRSLPRRHARERQEQAAAAATAAAADKAAAGQAADSAVAAATAAAEAAAAEHAQALAQLRHLQEQQAAAAATQIADLQASLEQQQHRLVALMQQLLGVLQLPHMHFQHALQHGSAVLHECRCQGCSSPSHSPNELPREVLELCTAACAAANSSHAQPEDAAAALQALLGGVLQVLCGLAGRVSSLGATVAELRAESAQLLSDGAALAGAC